MGTPTGPAGETTEKKSVRLDVSPSSSPVQNSGGSEEAQTQKKRKRKSDIGLYKVPPDNQLWRGTAAYGEKTRDLIGLHCTLVSYHHWERSGFTNGAGKPIPLTPSKAITIVFDHQLHVHLKGKFDEVRENDQGLIQLLDERGCYVKFNAQSFQAIELEKILGDNGAVQRHQYGFTGPEEDRDAREVVWHSRISFSDKLRTVLVKTNILDPLVEPDFFTKIIAHFRRYFKSTGISQVRLFLGTDKVLFLDPEPGEKIHRRSGLEAEKHAINKKDAEKNRDRQQHQKHDHGAHPQKGSKHHNRGQVGAEALEESLREEITDVVWWQEPEAGKWLNLYDTAKQLNLRLATADEIAHLFDFISNAYKNEDGDPPAVVLSSGSGLWSHGLPLKSPSDFEQVFQKYWQYAHDHYSQEKGDKGEALVVPGWKRLLDAFGRNHLIMLTTLHGDSPHVLQGINCNHFLLSSGLAYQKDLEALKVVPQFDITEQMFDDKELEMLGRKHFTAKHLQANIYRIPKKHQFWTDHPGYANFIKNLRGVHCTINSYEEWARQGLTNAAGKMIPLQPEKNITFVFDAEINFDTPDFGQVGAQGSLFLYDAWSQLYVSHTDLEYTEIPIADVMTGRLTGGGTGFGTTIKVKPVTTTGSHQNVEGADQGRTDFLHEKNLDLWKYLSRVQYCKRDSCVLVSLNILDVIANPEFISVLIEYFRRFLKIEPVTLFFAVNRTVLLVQGSSMDVTKAEGMNALTTQDITEVKKSEEHRTSEYCLWECIYDLCWVKDPPSEKLDSGTERFFKGERYTLLNDTLKALPLEHPGRNPHDPEIMLVANRCQYRNGTIYLMNYEVKPFFEMFQNKYHITPTIMLSNGAFKPDNGIPLRTPHEFNKVFDLYWNKLKEDGAVGGPPHRHVVVPAWKDVVSQFGEEGLVMVSTYRLDSHLLFNSNAMQDPSVPHYLLSSGRCLNNDIRHVNAGGPFYADSYNHCMDPFEPDPYEQQEALYDEDEAGHQYHEPSVEDYEMVHSADEK